MAEGSRIGLPGRGFLARRLVRLASALERRSRGATPPAVTHIAPGVNVGPDVHFVGGGDPIVVGEGAWLAHGARLLPGVEVGPGAVVLPYAVVHHDVPADAIVQGNPAAVVGRRSEAEGRS